jgi:hypothetical protein
MAPAMARSAGSIGRDTDRLDPVNLIYVKAAGRRLAHPCHYPSSNRPAIMARYYFHLRRDDHIVWDDEGVDLPDLRTVHGAAAQAAERLWSAVLCASDEPGRRMIAVTDEAGQLVAVVTLP